MSIVVALMLKAPQPGHVKTRLARTIGTEKATQVYRKLVEHQIAQIPAHWRIQIYYTPSNAGDEMQTWLGPDYDYSAQTDGDLGQRLSEVMLGHFKSEEPMPLVFVGADCPYLTTERLTAVESDLRDADAILIPATDGGYCLLALQRPLKTVFSDISWGTECVADATRDRLQGEQVYWIEFPALEDVDDEATWLRARELYPI
jgi:rSAM/selenodomain-associated transferase 1